MNSKIKIARNMQASLYFIEYLKQETNIISNFIDNIIDGTNIDIFSDIITSSEITLNNKFKYYYDLNNIIYKESNFIKEQLIDIVTKTLDRLGLCEGEEPSLRSMFLIDTFTTDNININGDEDSDDFTINYIELEKYSNKILKYIENQVHDKIIIEEWCKYELDNEF